MKRLRTGFPRIATAASIIALLALNHTHIAIADDNATDTSTKKTAPSSDRLSHIVATVGKSAITVDDLEKRLNALSVAQLRKHGSSPDDAKRNYLMNVMIPELLIMNDAADRGLINDARVCAKRNDRLTAAVLKQVREDTLANRKVDPQDIAAFYEANKTKYETPAMVSVWRILAADQDTATRVIRLAGKTPTPNAWLELSTAFSKDKSSNLRGGNLGFLTEDGISQDGKTMVPPDIVKAAMSVRDGEIVSEPVPEGSGFAVVWRRGSQPAWHRTLEDESKNIEQAMQAELVRVAEEALIESLRKSHARSVMPSGTELIAVTNGGELAQADKPGRLVRRPGRTTPLPTPRGMR
jgi:peptidyl-prolyl cis-trans isomerase C